MSILNPAGIAALGLSPQTLAMLAHLGEQIAADARAAAPKDTGEGAESIGYEVGVDNGVGYVRVSWDREHFYMVFHETGTSEMSPRPFLRPALTKRRTL